MRRRIWCEFLPAEQLADPATLSLLTRYRLEPLIAVPPAAETPGLARALRRLADARIPIGLWPLLADEDGYWPSEDNSAAFCHRVAATLSFARAAGAHVATVAVDLEPQLHQIRDLLDGPAWRSGLRLAARARGVATAPRRRARQRAVHELGALAASLHADGIETLAAVVPHVLLDLAAGVRIWQAILRTPVERPGWSAVSALMYSSLAIQTMRGVGPAAARALIHEGGRVLRRSLGSRASLSLGLVGAGKLGDEAVLPDPAALRADVEVARAAGVDDLALFSLEGVLGRGPPEPWLDAFTEAEPRLSPAARERALRLGLRLGAVSGAAASRALGYRRRG